MAPRPGRAWRRSCGYAEGGRMRTRYVPETSRRILCVFPRELIERSNIPMLTINLLYALPKTPLWRRLETERRLVDDEGRESNVAFRLPYRAVLDMWRKCIVTAYDPPAVYARYAHNQRHTFRNRKAFPVSAARASWRNILQASGCSGASCGGSAYAGITGAPSGAWRGRSCARATSSRSSTSRGESPPHPVHARVRARGRRSVVLCADGAVARGQGLLAS